MADRLTLYLAKSIAKYLGDALSVDAYVTTPDFNYDTKPNPSDPSQRIPRPLPFIGVDILLETRNPFTMGNILVEAEVTFNISVYHDGYSNLLNLTGDAKQALHAAQHPISAEVGVPLYDFSTPSGVFYDLVGAVEIFDFGVTNYFGPSETEEFANRKNRSITPVVFSAFKDKNATLLENLGNISIND